MIYQKKITTDIIRFCSKVSRMSMEDILGDFSVR
jgi:hypothetical protein